MTQTNTPASSDIEQAVDNIKIDELKQNLADTIKNSSDDHDEAQKPASLSDEEKTAFIDEQLRTDK